MVLPMIGKTLIGMTFLRKYSVTFDIGKCLVHFSYLSLQLEHSIGKYKCKMSDLRGAQKLVQPRFQQIMVPMCTNEDMSTSQDTVEAIRGVIRKTALLVTLAIVNLGNNKTVIQICNPTDRTYTINTGAVLAKFTILTLNQARNVKPMPLKQLSLISHFPEEALQVFDQLFQEPT